MRGRKWIWAGARERERAGNTSTHTGTHTLTRAETRVRKARDRVERRREKERKEEGKHVERARGERHAQRMNECRSLCDSSRPTVERSTAAAAAAAESVAAKWTGSSLHCHCRRCCSFTVSLLLFMSLWSHAQKHSLTIASADCLHDCRSQHCHAHHWSEQQERNQYV